MTEHKALTDDHRTIAKLIKGVRIAMLTTAETTGRLVSRPMTTQDVEFDGDIWFIAERDSESASQIGAGNADVNVAYAGSSSWVSVSGKARLVDDRAKLREEWNRFTEAFFEGGPETPTTSSSWSKGTPQSSGTPRAARSPSWPISPSRW